VKPGRVVMFGSGEISSTAQPVYDELLAGLARPAQIAVLETPAGFQPNSREVAEEVARYLREHVPQHAPRVAVLPARRRGTADSPDNAALLGPLFMADVMFLGPGSPSYAVRHLRDSLAWQTVLARHRAGSSLVLASAATVAAGAWALPVYEIYKSGENLHWIRGLDLWGAYGLSLVFVPHWDNGEGGRDLDTSRCFMGKDRFERLLVLLPPEHVVVGIDEHTALLVDAGSGMCTVRGRGGVTLRRAGHEERVEADGSFPMAFLGAMHLPEPGEGIASRVLELIDAAEHALRVASAPPAEVLRLVAEREAARTRRDWAAADWLREEIGRQGWAIRDTGDGPELVPQDSLPGDGP